MYIFQWFKEKMLVKNSWQNTENVKKNKRNKTKQQQPSFLIAKYQGLYCEDNYV